MANDDIVSAILHYKRNIDKISDTPERALKYEDRLLHCINKLYKLPVNVNHLQETGVGRTVNSLRKIEGEKGLGDAAKALVAKWKTMVMLEDEAERKQQEEISGPSEEDLKRIKLIREAEKSVSKKTEDKYSKSSANQSIELYRNRKHRDKSLDNNINKRRKLDDSDDETPSKPRQSVTFSNKKSANDALISDDLKIKEKNYLNNNENESSSKNNSSSTDKISNSHKSQDSLSYKKEKRKDCDLIISSSCTKEHNLSHKSKDKNESKEKKKSNIYVENNGYDSQSGASFADALGPIVVKKTGKKKTYSAIPSPGMSDCSNVNSLLKEPKKNLPKLEPLEADLMATLPTPTPYYKPYPSYIPTQEAVRKRVQAEEDALTTIMSNKNTRTKVYSGVKGGLSYVPSLYECCCRVLQQHIDALEYTGGIPFSLLKPVLEGATPSQLYQFEHFNPYIIEDTDDLWKFHVNKEFRSEKRQEFESWRDMYLRCVDEREEKYKAVTANIIQRTIENSIPVRKAKLAYIDVAKPPRNILKKQIKNGTSKPDSSRLLGKNDPDAVKVSAPKQPTTREPSSFKVKPKVAPLMQKTLKSIKMARLKR